MALREKVLRKKAQKFELKELEKNKIIPERVTLVEELLNDVYLILRPKPADYANRRDLVRVFNEIAKEIYGNTDNSPVVEEFGSFSMDLFTAKSDLDLSVNFGNKSTGFPREKKIKEIQKFAKKFYTLQRNGHVSGINPVTTAKVPIVKVVDRGTGIECDISIENRDGILKSKLIRIISSIDERFQKLSFLMKAWAKAQGINSSKDRTLNSLSIILLVAFHLQTRDPPILPAFSAIFKDGADPASVVKVVQRFLNYGKKNGESLAGLFVTLLIKLSSVERLWSKGLCASTYEGFWISKTWDSKVGLISVEDFTERSQNVARAVGTSEVKKIYRCIQLSIQHLFAFMSGLIQGPRLRELLFGHGGMPILLGSHGVNLVKNLSMPCIFPEPVNTKMVQPMETWERKPQAMPSEPILTKRMRSVGGMPSGIWGGTHVQGWGRVSTGSWGPTPTVVWGGMPMEGWGRVSADGWGTTPTEAWGGTFQSTAPPGRWQHDTNQSKRMRYTRQEGEIQADGEASFNNVNRKFLSMAYCSSASASSLGNQVSRAVPKAAVHNNSPFGLENCTALPHTTFVASTYPLALDGASAMNHVPKPYVRR